MATYRVYNEDGEILHTESHASAWIAAARTRQWLLRETQERRDAIGSSDDPDGWIATLLDNGFYRVEAY